MRHGDMSQHIERMKIEHNELKVKLEALNCFIHKNEIFKDLDHDEQIRMIQQAGFMKSYLDVLNSRLWVAHGNK
jgi:peptidoglycan hydrolase CwlO-like protein